MKKPIKYRVWCNVVKEWVTNSTIVAPDGELLSLKFLVEDDGKKVTPIINRLKQEDFVVEEFVGKVDKKGKDIYEGDILKFGGITHGYSNVKNDWVGKVEWNGCGWGVDWINRHLNECWGFEILGNIHENPELLKQ